MGRSPSGSAYFRVVIGVYRVFVWWRKGGLSIVMILNVCWEWKKHSEQAARLLHCKKWLKRNWLFFLVFTFYCNIPLQHHLVSGQGSQRSGRSFWGRCWWTCQPSPCRLLKGQSLCPPHRPCVQIQWWLGQAQWALYCNREKCISWLMFLCYMTKKLDTAVKCQFVV